MGPAGVPATRREARHPFLAEEVVAAVLALPLPLVADLRAPPGVGDKRLLRRCLAGLGLPRAAARQKRAIQFGSRIALASNRHVFGGTRAANAKAAGSVRLGQLPVVAQRGAAAPVDVDTEREREIPDILLFLSEGAPAALL